MKRWSALCIAAAAVLVGCAEPTSPAASGASGDGAPCRPGPVVPWSSEETSPSRLTVVSGGTELDAGTVAVKGIVPGGVNGNTIDGHAYFLSSGNITHDVTHLVDLDLTTCRGTAVRLTDVFNPLALATDGARFFTSNTINARSIIRRFDAQGVLRVAREIPDIGVTCLLLDAGAGRLYALANEFRSGQPDAYVLIVLDAQTLEVRSRHRLPLASASVSSAVLHDGRLVYPLSYDEETREQGRSLAVVELATVAAGETPTAETIDLPSALPYLLRLSGDTLYVGHTFMNPAFGPISQMRHVSRVDLATGTVVGVEVQAGIIDIDVTADDLYLLGQPDDDADRFVVETYDGGALRRTDSVAVTRPSFGGYFYPAGVIAP